MSLLSLAAVIATAALSATPAHGQRPLVCYWESWSRYRVAPYTGSVNNIPIHLCTHIVYAFAGLDENSWKVKSLEPYWDLDQGGFKQLVALKEKRPELKVSFAIGGWNEGGKKYSDLASDSDRIKIFVNSVAEWVNAYGFDGVDLDWEYPADAARDGKSEDKVNLIKLLKALREVLGRKLLTIATCVPTAKIAAGYDVPEMMKYVDFIHVMTYDLRGGWDSVIGNHVSLFPSSNDRGIYSQLTVEQGMQNWVDAGATPDKLIMGLAFYGRSFKLQNTINNKQGALSAGNGRFGPVSQQDGTLFYFEICKKLQQGWTRIFDNETKTPYAFFGDQWVGYDDTEGIPHKIKIVNRQKYAGVMLWAIDLDDASNSCGQGNYPLATATLEALTSEDDEENEIDVDPDDDSKKSDVVTGAEPDRNDTMKSTTEPDADEPKSDTDEPESDRQTTTPSGAEPGPVTESKTPPAVDCSSGSDFLPHPTKCSMYIRCVNRSPVEMSCPAGLIFDNSRLVCNWPFDVDPKLPEGCSDIGS